MYVDIGLILLFLPLYTAAIIGACFWGASYIGPITDLERQRRFLRELRRALIEFVSYSKLRKGLERDYVNRLVTNWEDERDALSRLDSEFFSGLATKQEAIDFFRDLEELEKKRAKLNREYQRQVFDEAFQSIEPYPEKYITKDPETIKKQEALKQLDSKIHDRFAYDPLREYRSLRDQGELLGDYGELLAVAVEFCKLWREFDDGAISDSKYKELREEVIKYCEKTTPYVAELLVWLEMLEESAEEQLSVKLNYDISRKNAKWIYAGLSFETLRDASIYARSQKPTSENP